uniref:Uncharacterized protein n=1 Tax=Chromera velia CCMP2878 TaxID=1169474 RepID=A0A0G4I0G1_9ALVE|eukprot:Cvel_9946.t1-p1 / transcript=Cvel_9946.t1 / gene=Cvel_9946 / organism=Chromera_velia_CCMP2878 / gene_product=hypothetical protein / transcript_product=hypothetical protein / location=Cvel_scaffold588:65358-69151(+) / protein_length=190 / sequence_SO=supercontig / SO=protein_coding / is_pseudo=false
MNFVFQAIQGQTDTERKELRRQMKRVLRLQLGERRERPGGIETTHSHRAVRTWKVLVSGAFPRASLCASEEEEESRVRENDAAKALDRVNRAAKKVNVLRTTFATVAHATPSRVCKLTHKTLLMVHPLAEDFVAYLKATPTRRTFECAQIAELPPSLRGKRHRMLVSPTRRHRGRLKNQHVLIDVSRAGE